MSRSGPNLPDRASGDSPRGRVLVVGGAGYIGSHTVRLLQGRGADVVVLDNLATGHRSAVTAPLERADLAERDAVRRILERHRPQTVIHFAARCYVGESVRDPALYYRENVIHTWNLLEEMRRVECRNLVFSSSCTTYGLPTKIPIPEDHVQRPISPYGRTKLAMEHMIDDYATAYDLDYAALRYFNAAGAAPDGTLGEDHRPETHLIPLVLQVALGQRDRIEVFGHDYETKDGTCVRDYTHVDDLAEAHLQAAYHLEQGGPALVCNLGTGVGYSVLEVIRRAREVTGHEIPHVLADRRPGDPPVLISDIRRAAELLDWHPRRPGLTDIITDAWRFHRDHPDGMD